MKYWFHERSNSYYKENNYRNIIEDSVELSEEEYFEALKSQKPKQNKNIMIPKTTLKVGNKVGYDDGDNKIVGIITAIEGKLATVEDDENQYELPLKELILVKDKDNPLKGKKVVKKSEPEPEDDDDDENDDDDKKPKKKSKGKGKSLMSMFIKAEKADIKGGIPLGEWSALVTDAVLEEKKEGVSAYFEFTGTENEAAGKTTRKYYFLCDGSGEEAQGMAYFKADCEILGYDVESLEEDDDMQEVLDAIKKEQAWVDIKVVPQKNNPQYNNVYINGLKEDQDDKPDLDDIPMN